MGSSCISTSAWLLKTRSQGLMAHLIYLSIYLSAMLIHREWAEIEVAERDHGSEQRLRPQESRGKRSQPQSLLTPMASFRDPPTASTSAHSLILIGLERSYDKLQEAESQKEAMALILTYFGLFPWSSRGLSLLWLEARLLIGQSGERLQEDYRKRPKWVRIEAAASLQAQKCQISNF